MPADQHAPRVTADVALEYHVFDLFPTKRTSPFTSVSQCFLVPSAGCGVFLAKVSVSFGLLSEFCLDQQEIRGNSVQRVADCDAE